MNCGIRLKLPACNLPTTLESIFTHGRIRFYYEAPLKKTFRLEVAS